MREFDTSDTGEILNLILRLTLRYTSAEGKWEEEGSSWGEVQEIEEG